MRSSKTSAVLLIISVTGTLFSGFLSYSKLFLNNCAVDPGCAYFLGMPASYIGFAFFLSLLVISAIHYFYKNSIVKIVSAAMLLSFSFFAMLFASYITYIELKYPPCQDDCHYVLLMPSCFYGTILFVLVFIFSITELLRLRSVNLLGPDNYSNNL